MEKQQNLTLSHYVSLRWSHVFRVAPFEDLSGTAITVEEGNEADLPKIQPSASLPQRDKS
ncbi:MAG: hypothetical protein AAGF26_09100 [Cyanobacteria bacterium P01_G01_bin.49]